jgi:hypothetical protein
VNATVNKNYRREVLWWWYGFTVPTGYAVHAPCTCTCVTHVCTVWRVRKRRKRVLRLYLLLILERAPSCFEPCEDWSSFRFQLTVVKTICTLQRLCLWSRLRYGLLFFCLIRFAYPHSASSSFFSFSLIRFISKSHFCFHLWSGDPCAPWRTRLHAAEYGTVPRRFRALPHVEKTALRFVLVHALKQERRYKRKR